MTHREPVGDHVAAIPMHKGRILLLQRNRPDAHGAEWEFAGKTLEHRGGETWAQPKFSRDFGRHAADALRAHANLNIGRTRTAVVQTQRLLGGPGHRAFAKRHHSVLVMLESQEPPAVQVNGKEYGGFAWAAQDELGKYALKKHERSAALLAFKKNAQLQRLKKTYTS